MPMRHSIALDNLKKTIPPTDEDQKLALLYATFTGTTFFGAKLQEANMKQASALTMLPSPAVPLVSYSARPFVGRGRKVGYSQKKDDWGRGQGRPGPTGTITKPRKGQK